MTNTASSAHTCARSRPSALALGLPGRLPAADLSVVSLFECRAQRIGQQLGWRLGHRQICRMSACSRNGSTPGGGPCAAKLGPTRAGEVRYAQMPGIGFGRTAGHRQVRDLARFQRLAFAVMNRTGVPLRGTLQIKDYRDSLAQRAVYRFFAYRPRRHGPKSICGSRPATPAGKSPASPICRKSLTIDFGFEPPSDLPAGCVCLDDLTLTEAGGPLDVAASPLKRLVERLAPAAVEGLWPPAAGSMA